MRERSHKHQPALRTPRREWESYTLDDIEEIIAFYLGAETPSTEQVNKEVEFVQPDLAIYSVTLEGKVTDTFRLGFWGE